MKRKVIGWLCIAAVIGGALSGCQRTAKEETVKDAAAVTDDAETDEAKAETVTAESAEDSIVAYVGQYFWDGSLDPVKGKFSNGYDFINNALITVDVNSEYVADLATEWEVSEDALEYTFHLRKGVTFHDGSDFTAEDVVFTYETVKANQADNENVDLTKMRSVEAIDDYTVKITLSEAYSPFLDGTAQLGIVPSDHYDPDTFGDAPIGTGAWKFIQLDTDQQLIVEANEDYFEGAPAIKKVTFLNMDNEAAFANAKSGQLDIVMVQPNYAVEEVENMHIERLATMDVRNISLPYQTVQTAEKDGKEITVGNAVTSDAAVRKALNIGVNRKRIIENAFNGVGKPAQGFTSNLEWGNTKEYEDGQVEAAITILEEAGWKDEDGDGIREKDGLKCEFDVYTPASEGDRFQLATAAAQEAAALGISIQVKQGSWDELLENSHTSGIVWGYGQFNPLVISNLFYSANFMKSDFSNTNGYKNEKVDDLIESAITSADHNTAIQMWKDAQTEFAEDYAYLFLVNIEHCYFVSDRLDISTDTQIPHGHGHGMPIICNMKDWTLK